MLQPQMQHSFEISVTPALEAACSAEGKPRMLISIGCGLSWLWATHLLPNPSSRFGESVTSVAGGVHAGLKPCAFFMPS